MTRRLFIFIFFIYPLISFGQNELGGIGQWREHFNNLAVIQLGNVNSASSEYKILGASNQQVFFLSEKNNYLELKNFYQAKRDLFLKLTQSSRLKPLKTVGTYFQLMSYKDISTESDTDFAIKLTKENKLATIPLSVFYTNKYDNKILRFCFAKKDETLEKAAEIINRL